MCTLLPWNDFVFMCIFRLLIVCLFLLFLEFVFLFCTTGLQLIEQAQLFTHLTVETQSLLRRIIVELVLATDMKMHFDFVGEFRTAIQNREGKITPKLLLQDECVECHYPQCFIWTRSIFCSEGLKADKVAISKAPNRAAKISFFGANDTPK